MMKLQHLTLLDQGALDQDQWRPLGAELLNLHVALRALLIVLVLMIAAQY